MPYVETWFDAIDYIDEITTEQLEKELKRRGTNLSEPLIDVIRDELELAWDKQDDVSFQRAIAMLQDPDKEEKRRDRVAVEYKKFMEQVRTNH